MFEQKKAQPTEGEELIWTGSPCEEKEYGRADWVLVPVSTLLLALSAGRRFDLRLFPSLRL